MRYAWMLVVSVLLVGCGTVTPARRGGTGRYAQSMDSATSSCMRSPACYAATGDDAVLPWLLRGAGAVRTTAVVLRLLDTAELGRVEELLEECARQAHFEVNEQQFGQGKRPTREQCDEVVKNPWNQDVKRAVELGRLKHEAALRCVQEALEKLFPGNYSLEPRYAYDLKTKQTRLISREQVEEWLRSGWLHLLVGTLVPDVVLHETGNPLKVQRVYDFKFPCANDNHAQWRPYPPKHPYHPKDQGQMYKDALNGADLPATVSPVFGISR
ncbi:hypothetical protein [Pyxidicoccus xibeiensis]|uniref:hypothetical protein n=1 Tax=Pyxidicoccus xibeiensis TaxID=2906759 RepID=UPI0020A7A6FD|nr:hypothetical protein [Pyxidicoccus xibeiensis]MCP3137696.1 hypothetical protein [Pyxidicoccus xibeiensis]